MLNLRVHLNDFHVVFLITPKNVTAPVKSSILSQIGKKTRTKNVACIDFGHLPPTSSEPNPVDYKIQGVVKPQVCQSHVQDIDELNRRFLHIWHGMDQSIIDNAVNEWRRRLRHVYMGKR